MGRMAGRAPEPGVWSSRASLPGLQESGVECVEESLRGQSGVSWEGG